MITAKTVTHAVGIVKVKNAIAAIVLAVIIVFPVLSGVRFARQPLWR